MGYNGTAFRNRSVLVILACFLHLQIVYASFEQLSRVPRGWKEDFLPEPTNVVELRIALKQQNVEIFEQAIMDVSTPHHPKYGMHLTRDQVRDMLRPTDQSSREVIIWLTAAGVANQDINNDGDWIAFRTNISTAEKLLDTQFNWYSNQDGQRKLRTLQYSVPDNVANHINFVQPTTRFGHARNPNSSAAKLKRSRSAKISAQRPHRAGFNATFCNTTITPQCLQELYKIYYTPIPNNGNKLGVAGFLYEVPSPSNLDMFNSLFAPFSNSSSYSIVSVNGGPLDSGVGEIWQEAELDIQYATSIAYPTPVEYYSTGGIGYANPLIVLNSSSMYLINVNAVHLYPTIMSLTRAKIQMSHIWISYRIC
jgi:tripeptidyl-peptidase-1